MVTPPRGERSRRATGSEDCKRKNKENRQTSSIKGTGDQVRVVLEDARAVVSEVVLGEETRGKLTPDNAGLGLVVWDIAGVLDELRQVDVAKVKAANLGDKLSRNC